MVVGGSDLEVCSVLGRLVTSKSLVAGLSLSV